MANAETVEYVDHITIGGVTKFYKDAKGRQDTAAIDQRVTSLENNQGSSDFSDELAKLLFSGSGTVNAGVKTSSGDVIVNEDGDVITLSKAVTL